LFASFFSSLFQFYKFLSLNINITEIYNCTSCIFSLAVFSTLISKCWSIIAGNAGKKANRKEDSNSASASSTSSLSSSSLPTRPGRSRYRNFPPTEPEIHRGGFVPLPRGQGGFIPIVDPRLEHRPLNTSDSEASNGSKNLTKENESGSRVLHERKHIKTSNYNLGKIERTSGPLTNGQNNSRKALLS
jgi:hypothetical protein